MGIEVILGRWAFVWTLSFCSETAPIAGACRCSAPSMDTAKCPLNLTQPNQFLHWAVVPPGSAMCSHEEQSSFMLLSCPVPWFVCEPMLWSLEIAQGSDVSPCVC